MTECETEELIIVESQNTECNRILKEIRRQNIYLNELLKRENDGLKQVIFALEQFK